MKYNLMPGTIFSFLLLTFLLTGCQTNTYTHKQFHERVSRIRTIGLIPTVHTAILNRYYGNDPSPEPFTNQDQIRLELTRSAMTQLQQRGFIVAETCLPYFTNHVYSNILQEAASVATDKHVDGLMVLDVNAYRSTPHRQRITAPENTISFLLTVASIACLHPADFPYESWQGAYLTIELIDGQTGDVLWRTWKDFDDFNKNRPSTDVEELFHQYPKPKS